MSRPVTVTLSHDLGAEEAARRLRDGFGKMKSSLSGGLMMAIDEHWASERQMRFTAKALGAVADGVIDVFPQHVRIVVTLPGVLASIAEILAGKLEKEGTLLLEKK